MPYSYNPFTDNLDLTGTSGGGGGGFTWSDKNTSFTAENNNGYFCTAALTVTLPSSGILSEGFGVVIYCDTASVVTIQCATGERIEVGGVTSNAAGTAVSTGQGCILELIYRDTDLTWHAMSAVGSWPVSQ